MESKPFSSVYPYSHSEAKRLGEFKYWKESHKENIACKNAIEEAIRSGFDGKHLKKDCADGVIAEFGYHRTAYVLANSLQQKEYDRRFSHGNHDFAQQIYIPSGNNGQGSDSRRDFVVGSHPAVLDGFVNQYRRAFAALELFDRTHCLQDTSKQDFEGKVVVMVPSLIRETCLNQQSQLWLCTGGFGAFARARGRAVFVTNLDDGEKARCNREDFIGVLSDSHLPEWAKEKMEQLTGQSQTAEDSPATGGMTMQ